MTRNPDPGSPSDLGPNGAPDQSPPPTPWPMWIAIGIAAFLLLIALGQS